MTRRYLVTGGTGFIGSNFIRYVLSNEPEALVTNLGGRRRSGVPSTVDELDAIGRHTFIRGDVRDSGLVDRVMADHDIVVHFAAESHVDRSIVDPIPALQTNVLGTGVVIDAARRHGVTRLIHVSTGEVYGSVGHGLATEDAPLRPSSPYAASKAGSDLVVRSFTTTFSLPAIISRAISNFGPYQFPDKLIPRFITNLLVGEKVPLYGDGNNMRDWLHVEDHCAAIHLLIDEGALGEVYNIGTGSPLSNLEVTHRILDYLGRDESWIIRAPDRPGHDLRFAVDSSKIRALGWEPAHDLDTRLGDTIEWYRARQDWWQPLRKATP